MIRLLGTLHSMIYFLSGALLAAMCAFAMLQVIVRLTLTAFGINLSIPWSEEVGRFMMIWMIFLGAAYACRSGQMIALTFAVGRLPLYAQRYVDALSAIVCIAFFLLLIWVGVQAVEYGWTEKSPVLQLPKAYVYMAMPVGAGLMIINTVFPLVEKGLFRRHYGSCASLDRSGKREGPEG